VELYVPTQVVGALAPASLYVPAATSSAAEESPAPGIYVPAAARIGALVRPLLYMPAGSTISTLSEVAPVNGIYVV
jgi:hypothetical protein